MRLKNTLYYSGKIVIGSALGKVQTISKPMNYSSQVDLRMKCKLFSEGNLLLENVLYRLNELGLTTFASCKGHGSKHGYIAFILNEENKNLVSKMCSYLLEHTSADIAIHPHHYNAEGISVAIYFSVKDRKQILSSILNTSLYENIALNEIILEIIKLSEYQKLIHSDMTFGLYLEKRAHGYYVETEPKFLMRSLNRNISIHSLEVICSHLDELSDNINEKEISNRGLLKTLQITNNSILSIINNDTDKIRDYYPMFTEQELLRFIRLCEIEIGKLELIMKKIGYEELTSEESDYYCSIMEDDELYFLTLRLEESLKIKHSSIALQEEKRML